MFTLEMVAHHGKSEVMKIKLALAKVWKTLLSDIIILFSCHKFLIKWLHLDIFVFR